MGLICILPTVSENNGCPHVLKASQWASIAHVLICFDMSTDRFAMFEIEDSRGTNCLLYTFLAVSVLFCWSVA